MGWDVLLFDLDGTLTDSGPGIMHAAETALGSFGITGLSEQALRQFVGPPLVESFAVYLPQAEVQTAIDRFRAYYRETGWLENEPYPGVRECLHALKAAGKRMYVATSKLESMARQVLTHFDLMQYFDGVCGGIADDPEAGKKVNVVRRALREAGCDVLGMVAIFTYGFPTAAENFAGADVKLDTLSDYKTMIELAAKQGYVHEDELQTLQQWRRDPANWKKSAQ